MLLRKEDFQLKSANFCWRNPWNTFRMVSGFMLLPHALSKFADGGLNPGTVGFFAQVGFAPASFWVAMAAMGELVAGIALILGIATRFSALLAAGIMILAVASLHILGGFKWLWNLGGYEFPVFLVICYLLIAQKAFQDNK